MNRDYDNLCIVCSKSIIHKNYSNYFLNFLLDETIKYTYPATQMYLPNEVAQQ